MLTAKRFILEWAIFVFVFTSAALFLFEDDRPLSSILLRYLVVGLIAVSLTNLLPRLLRRFTVNK